MSDWQGVLDQETREMANRIEQFEVGSDALQTTLYTDERVLARVTDGIYRQPGSAIRELISNAYDADATRVVVQTDRPRFGRIVIEDDGAGISPAMLAYLLRHIGGSAKRTSDASTLGIAQAQDPARSPGGRRLIGKIGIGLFSLSQLTQAFQIITKTKGDSRRTVATVIMKQYSDDILRENPDERYEAGRVNIWREFASDIETHGTTIVLTAVRPQTKETLRSANTWAAIDEQAALPEGEERQTIEPFRFHIGRVYRDHPDLLRSTKDAYDSLPWEPTDTPLEAFRKLVDAVAATTPPTTPNPRLERILDYYLQMVWQLSLAVPLPYVDGHPFDTPFGDSVHLFKIPRSRKSSPMPIELTDDETVREALKLPEDAALTPDFTVLVDDLELRAPLKFRNLPVSDHAVKKPMLFVGQVREEFRAAPREFSGGPLEFEAYLLWNSRIIPTDHQGSLIRIHGSSGTLFDSTFLRYQVAEQTRLRQITCEIFVREGLESALNIDRESFNYAHPHMVFITRWLHDALRRVASAQKRISSELRRDIRATRAADADAEVEEIVERTWQSRVDDVGAPAPRVAFIDRPSAESTGQYQIARSAVFPGEERVRPTASGRRVERQLEGIARLLASFQLLDVLSESEQTRLLRAIREILEVGEDA